MLTEGIEAYYACFIGLIMFFAVVITNRVVPKSIRTLFYIQIIVIFVCLIDTWLNTYFKSLTPSNLAIYGNLITTTINYMLAPISSAIFVLVYIKHLSKGTKAMIIIPFLVNFICSLVNLFVPFEFYINANNEYIRVGTTFIPFLICLIYMGYLIFFAVKEKENRNKTYEIVLQIVNTVIISSAVVIEIVLDVRLLLWQTIFIASLFYYLELSLQLILQDSLTGALSSVAYEYFINVNKGHSGTISVINVNDLGFINSKYGKDVGDSVLVAVVASLLKNKGKHTFLYRIKEDSFILVSRDLGIEEVNDMLEKAKDTVSTIKDFKPSFAYGSAIFHEEDRLDDKIGDAQKLMEINKSHIKKVDIRS
jgi:GGDEF domain-containing protein